MYQKSCFGAADGSGYDGTVEARQPLLLRGTCETVREPSQNFFVVNSWGKKKQKTESQTFWINPEVSQNLQVNWFKLLNVWSGFYCTIFSFGSAELKVQRLNVFLLKQLGVLVDISPYVFMNTGAHLWLLPKEPDVFKASCSSFIPTKPWNCHPLLSVQRMIRTFYFSVMPVTPTAFTLLVNA